MRNRLRRAALRLEAQAADDIPLLCDCEDAYELSCPD